MEKIKQLAREIEAHQSKAAAGSVFAAAPEIKQAAKKQSLLNVLVIHELETLKGGANG